ncbi:MAG: hypothetical protein DDT19_02773 [Syntrophomonadaceae bacterium]|nr:hypothetical protein [Bacillota bacterium]
MDTGAYGLINRNQNTLVLTVGGMELRHEHEDVIDIDFDLPNQLNFKDNIFIDSFLFGALILSEILIQINIDALIVLKIPIRENFIAGEAVEGRQDILEPQDGSEEPDKVFLVLFSNDRLP